MAIENIYIGLGSNLGDRLGYLVKALALLARDPRIRLRRVSPVYRTAAVGRMRQPDFTNAVAHLQTRMEPEELLRCLQGVERRLGRIRVRRRGPRTVDLDILRFGRRVLCKGHLTLPHPLMRQRRFVLQPYADLQGRRLEVKKRGVLGNQRVWRLRLRLQPARQKP